MTMFFIGGHAGLKNDRELTILKVEAGVKPGGIQRHIIHRDGPVGIVQHGETAIDVLCIKIFLQAVVYLLPCSHYRN